MFDKNKSKPTKYINFLIHILCNLYIKGHLTTSVHITDHYNFDSSTDDSVYTTKFLSVKVNLSVAKMEPQLAEVVLSVCRVLAQECANQIICNRKKKRKIWVWDWVARRNILGVSNTLLTELQVEGRPDFMNYMTMSKGHFNILLKKLETRIQKQNTFFREAIPAITKLEITLRFLATGESYSSLQYFFRVNKSTISLFVPYVCTEMYNVLENFIKVILLQ